MNRVDGAPNVVLTTFAILLMALATLSCEETGPKSTTPPTQINATALWEEREANATRFDDTYKGNWATVSGLVAKIEGGDVHLVVDEESFDILGMAFETLALQDLPRDVQSSLDKRDEFTATCKVGNFIIVTMFLEDCYVGSP